ncbi:anti-sigma factor family protein [Streptacidiphilus cavernicola]|uniref:Anti-sigma factor n=1 Tax=Streptacidiphilus cavernicola TaxID=3342716 RepID=A0ABV6VUH9_9ACTN
MSEQSRRARPQDLAVEMVELRVARPSTATAVPPVPVEGHLGDRLAAFVDGELDHDARERVQSHLATCDACLGRAEEERRVKSRISAAPPPDPSALFMSRLMSIAGDSDQQPPSSGPQQPRRGFGGSAFGGGATGGFGGTTGGWGSNGLGGGRFGSGALGAEHPLPGVDPRAERRLPFQDQAGPIAARLRSGFAPAASADYRDDSPQRLTEREQDRTRRAAAPRPSAARGRRFAFAAAGAFSVAAVALGGAITGVTAAEPTVDEPYGNVAPVADTSPGAQGGADRSRGGQLAYGVPADVPAYIPTYNSQYEAQYGGQFGPGAPAASATALPTGYAAAGAAVR